MSEVFKNISNELADTVANAGSGVIRVEGRKRLAATGIAWQENIIVTADHVVRDEDLKVGLPNGEVVTATMVGRDRNTDIAVLRVETALAPLPLAGEGDALRVGNLVLAIGKPGNNLQSTLGVVSALGTGNMDGVIQTDVVMYPGFSGGPLVDASGKVQGMNTSGFRSGAAIAIATHKIQSVVETLLTHGKMRQGYLGVGAQPVRLAEDIAQQIDQETGLMIASIEVDSPAASASMYQGDIIVAVDNEPTPHLDALLMLLSGDRVGKTVPVKVVRGGQLVDTEVTIGERAESEEPSRGGGRGGGRGGRGRHGQR